MKARIVTVHLVIREQNDNEPNTRYDEENAIADGISALLGDAEGNGFLLDWGYAKGGMPEDAKVIDDDDYEEGDFYDRASLESPVSERMRAEIAK